MKQISVVLGILLCAANALAGGYGERLSHRGVLEIGVGECNTLTSSASADLLVKDMAGMGGLIGIGYEMARGPIFGGIMVHTDYSLMRQQVKDYDEVRVGYVDKLPNPAEVRYHYWYDYFVETQRQWSVGAMLYMGGELTANWYMLGGLKLSTMISADFLTHVSFSTCKQYSDIYGSEGEWVDVIESWAADGNYPIHTITRVPCEQFTWGNSTPNNNHPMRLRLAPEIEIGWKHTLPSQGLPVEMRVGAFAEWGFPLVSTNEHSLNLVDYSQLENRRNADGLILIPDNQPQLDDLLRFNSVLNSRYISHRTLLSITQLSVGIKLAFVLNAGDGNRYRSASRKKDCNCL